MRLNWNFLRLAVLAAAVLASTGCSGINGSQSVSPASFFLPGLLKNDCQTNAPALIPKASSEIASAN